MKISRSSIVEKKYEIALSCLILFSIFTAYSYGIADHFIKIPFVQVAIDPSLYSRDMTVGMGDYYTSYLYALILPFEKIMGMELAYFVVYVFASALFYTSVYLIGRRLFSNKMVGLIAVMMLLTAKPTLAGLGVVSFDSYLTARSVGFAIVMFSLYLFIIKRRAWSGFLLGLAANIHVIIAVNAGLLVLVMFIAEWVADRAGKKFFRQVFLFGTVTFIGMLPILIRQLGLSGDINMLTVVDPEWLNIIFQSGRAYVIADTINFSLLLMYVLGVLLSCLMAAMVPGLPLPPSTRNILLSVFVTMLVGFGLFVFFSRVWPLLLGIDLCFHRTSKIFIVFFYIFLAYLLHEHFNSCRVVLLAWVLVFAKFVDALFLVYALLLLATVILLKEVYRKYFNAPAGAATDFFKAVNRGIGIGVIMALFLIGLSAEMKWTPRFNNPLARDTSPSIDTQLWLRDNTPLDALVLSPPGDIGFRIYSQRSIVGNARDSTYANISRAFAFELRERGADLVGYDGSRIMPIPPLIDFKKRGGFSFRRKVEKKMKNYYAGLDAVRIQEFIDKYAVDYVVMYVENRLPLPLLYENELYAVYGPFPREE